MSADICIDMRAWVRACSQTCAWACAVCVWTGVCMCAWQSLWTRAAFTVVPCPRGQYYREGILSISSIGCSQWLLPMGQKGFGAAFEPAVRVLVGVPVPDKKRNTAVCDTRSVLHRAGSAATQPVGSVPPCNAIVLTHRKRMALQPISSSPRETAFRLSALSCRPTVTRAGHFSGTNGAYMYIGYLWHA